MKVTININTKDSEIPYVIAALATTDFALTMDQDVPINDSHGNAAGHWHAMSASVELKRHLPARWWDIVKDMTGAQLTSAIRVIERQGANVLREMSMYDGTVMLIFSNITIGIEPDGYAHS